MKVMVPLAQGLEEIEAVTIIDVLRRAGLTVHTASLEPGPVEGSHGITLEADYTLSELKASDYECLALPGGMPGSENLSKSAALADWIRDIHGRGGYLAAVCAAPMVLGGAGVLKGRTVTCYPGFETYCTGAAITGAPVEVDGAIITGRGAGCALPFALELAGLLAGQEKKKELVSSMQVYWMRD